MLLREKIKTKPKPNKTKKTKPPPPNKKNTTTTTNKNTHTHTKKKGGKERFMKRQASIIFFKYIFGHAFSSGSGTFK